MGGRAIKWHDYLPVFDASGVGGRAVRMATPPRVIKRKPQQYLTNKSLLAEIIACRMTGHVSEALGKMLLLLTERYFTKQNYRGYSFVDEIRGEAVSQCLVAVLKFNPERSSNPFAYLTTVMTNSACRTLNREKRLRVTRDEALSEAGMSPSHTALIENDATFWDMDHPPATAVTVIRRRR